MLRLSKFLATALVIAACAETPDPDSTDTTDGKADGQVTTLTFARDWSEKADGALVAGLTVRVRYDLDRLTACRGYSNGSDAWGITGYAQFDGGAPQAFEVTRIVNGHTVRNEPEVEIPARAAHVQFWFQNADRYGCVAYDSNENANYSFDIEARPDVAFAAFEANGSVDLPRSVRAGDNLVVHFDPQRLATCAGSSGGNAAWSVTLNYQVDGGTVKKILATRAEGPSLVAADPEITLPRGRDLAMWFEATNRWGCHEYDSNNSANYHIGIE
jgi:hypothetical protein